MFQPEVSVDIVKKKKISRKQDLTFHANCLRRQFARNVESCFLGKKSSAQLAQSVVKING